MKKNLIEAEVAVTGVKAIEALSEGIASVRGGVPDDAKALTLSRRRSVECIVGDGEPTIGTMVLPC